MIAFGVCDTPDVFYETIETCMPIFLEYAVLDILRIVDAKGLGYGISSEEELESAMWLVPRV